MLIFWLAGHVELWAGRLNSDISTSINSHFFLAVAAVIFPPSLIDSLQCKMHEEHNEALESDDTKSKHLVKGAGCQGQPHIQRLFMSANIDLYASCVPMQPLGSEVLAKNQRCANKQMVPTTATSHDYQPQTGNGCAPSPDTMVTQNSPSPMFSMAGGPTSANMQQRWTDEAQQYSPYWPPFSGTENDRIGDNLQDEDCNYEQAAAMDERLENPVALPAMVLYSLS